ncbi:MAG TPA: hypothetical protein VKT80_11190, partial [Chloroflexota bacterium]|nr:hypothetical protein [Chloroflexota bacterium]
TAAVADQGPPVHPTSNQLSACLQLAGWESEAEQRTDLSVLALTFYWFSRCDTNSDQEVVVELRDPTGHSVVRYHRQPRWGTMPMSTWYSGELIRDVHEIVLPSGLSGGQYDIGVGLARAGEPRGTLQSVGKVIIPATGPGTPESLPFAPSSTPIDFAGGLSLVGWKVSPGGTPPLSLLRPGATVSVSVLLRARDEVSVDGVVSVFLADREQRKYSPRDGYPPSDLLFTGAWLRGEAHPQSFDVPVPVNLAPGAYDLALEVYNFASGTRLAVLGDTAADNPTRAILQTFKVPMPSQPPPTYRIGRVFAGQIAVDGYDAAVTTGADANHTQIDLDVHWRAIHNLLPAYHSFVHVYDQAGKLVAQSDGPVGGLAYPSNIWDVNDAVIDRHTIAVPPDLAVGVYALRAGLYLPASGNRLTLDGGGDTVDLGTLVVQPGSGAPSLRVVPVNGA